MASSHSICDLMSFFVTFRCFIYRLFFFTWFFLFISDDCGVFVNKFVEFLMVGKSVPKVTRQQISYFDRKMCLELSNHITIKATGNAKSDDDIT